MFLKNLTMLSHPNDVIVLYIFSAFFWFWKAETNGSAFYNITQILNMWLMTSSPIVTLL